ncbi:MAG: uncharacterized protein QOH74_1185 [Gaiellales bacterium]|nr:uncharacterized protein [Gaiellales bacterium]
MIERNAGPPAVGSVSPEQEVEIVVEQNIRVPMRDGVTLSLDLLRPAGDDLHPVVLIRTPYDKVLCYQSWHEEFLRSLVRRGYAVAVQDVRGRFNSDGAFFPYRHETEDGHDTVEWIGEQPWCDGNVGMYGASYYGRTQCAAAAAHPAHLKAIVPICATPPELFFNFPVLNGVFVLPMAEWAVTLGYRSYQAVDVVDNLFKRRQPYYDALPLGGMVKNAGTTSDWWDEMMRHPNLDDFWHVISYEDAFTSGIPSLNITGWYDMSLPGAPSTFVGMTASGKATSGADKLVIGPWPHWPLNGQRVLNGVDFGEQAVIDLEGYIVRFLDRWLKGARSGIEDEAPVRVFVMGANEWWAADRWPLAETEYVPYYFRSGGAANSSSGDGRLSARPPGDEPADTFVYDPHDAAGLVWSMFDGPVDETEPSSRPDVLCYTTDPFTEPLDIVGPVTCELYASSSARDTDWHVRLVDVWPDGIPRFLCHGVLRARFRDSFHEPTLLEPGEVYRFRFEMDPVGVRMLPGHRLRVELSSSWFPRFDRNTGSGAANNFLDDQVVVATQTVLHDAGHPSHILLPVIPAEA